MGKLEGALKRQRSIGSDSVGVAPILSVGGPSSADLKAQQKEAASAAKAVAAADKLAQRDALASQKAADRARIAEEKSTAKQLEKAAKDESNFQRLVAQNRLKADKLEAKERETAAKATAKKLKEAYDNSLTGSFSNAFGEANKASGTFETLGATLGELLNPATLAAVAIAGLGAALTAAVIGGASLAIQATELKGDTVDALEAFLGSQEAAEETYDRINDITRDVAISQERATALARELSAAGITSSAALTDAIKSIGQVESVLGSEAGGKIQSVLEKSLTSGKFNVNAKQLAGTGVQIESLYAEIGAQLGIGNKQVEAQLKAGKISAEVGVAALTKTLDTKFGALAQKQLLDIGNQSQKLKDSFSKLFEDVNTGPFLDAISSLVSLFDDSTETGKALKQTITSIFDKVFELAADAIPYVRIAFKSLVLIGLDIWNAFRPVFAQFDFFDSASDGANTFADTMLTVADGVGKVAGWFATLVSYKPLWYGLGVIVGVVAAGIAVLAAGAALAAIPIYAIGAAALYLIGWLAQLEVKAIEVGAGLITGLVQGIQNGAGFLIDAVSNLGKSAVKAFKDVFQIHSPSRVMMAMGDNLTLGLAHGIDLGAPAVNDSLTSVVDPVAAIAPARAAGGIGSLGQQQSQSPSTSKTIQVNEGAVQITIQGVPNAEQIIPLLTPVIKDVFVRLAESEAA